MTDRDGYYWNYNDKFETNTPSFLESSQLPFQDNPAKRKEDLIKLTESTLGRNYLRNAIGRDEYGINIVKVIKSKANNLLELIEKEINNNKK